MENIFDTTFSLNQDWITKKEAVVFGVFEGENIPCGLGFKKETATKEAKHLFPLFSKIKQHFTHNDFSGKFGETATLYLEGTLYKRIILCGLGKKEVLNLEKIRIVAATAISLAKQMNISSISFTLFGSPSHHGKERLRSIFEGAALALYTFETYKQKGEDSKTKKINAINFLLPEIISEKDIAIWQADLKRYKTIISGVYFARNIVNHPANVVTPQFLSDTAQSLSKQCGASCEVMDEKKLKEMNMRGILAVGGGSQHAPRMIVLRHNAKSKHAPTVALVGKGVCFDSGGISLKPSQNMDEMKMDMAGAAAVMGAFFACTKLALQINIIAIIPTVENMPGGASYRPGDIIKSASGKTIEVLDTDAEGRIILADALHYAVTKYKPTHVIDLATLTGACMVALGHDYAGIFAEDKMLIQTLKDAGMQTGEHLWHMPSDEIYKKQIKSEIADVKNLGGNGKYAGAITAAIFLKEFIHNHKSHAHIDIAGPAILPEKNIYCPKGGSGFGVRLLIEFLEETARKNKK